MTPPNFLSHPFKLGKKKKSHTDTQKNFLPKQVMVILGLNLKSLNRL